MKKTLWLERFGYMEDTPDWRYIIKRSQNVITPRIGDYLDEKEIANLIDDEVTININ